jgi:carbonic anhydrase/acetyltransferase-like protein (isoleucine patch superfamily)
MIALLEVKYFFVVKFNLVKGDVNLIEIGAVTNVQEGTVITEAFGPLDMNHDGGTIIGHFVTIGKLLT